MKKIYYRHGDLNFHPIKKLPENLKRVKFKGEYILALGETTGHAHRFKTDVKTDEAQLFIDSKGRLVLQFGEKSYITHEEHKTIMPGTGFRILIREREYDYFVHEIRKVID